MDGQMNEPNDWLENKTSREEKKTNNGEESVKQVKTKLNSVTKFQSKTAANKPEKESDTQSRKNIQIIVANQLINRLSSVLH